MTRLRIHWAALTAGAILSLTCSAWGQATDLGSRPTFSPWFGLYQRNGGPLDNYHTFVRPKVELNDALLRQQADIQHNTSGINALDQEMTQSQQQGFVRPTGTGSVFMNYSHYYPVQGAGGRTAQGPVARRSWSPQAASSGRAKAAGARGS